MSTPRAKDPATHEDYASPNALHRFVGWMWSKYSRKAVLKIGVIAAPVINAIVQWAGQTPEASMAIGVGLSALILGTLDQVVSFVGKRMGLTNLQSLQKISEEDEAETVRPPATPWPGGSASPFSPPSFYQALIEQQPTNHHTAMPKEPMKDFVETLPRVRGLVPVATVQPIGNKGDFIIAISPDEPLANATRGKLRGEVDELVIIEVEDGRIVTFNRAETEFYVKA